MHTLCNLVFILSFIFGKKKNWEKRCAHSIERFIRVESSEYISLFKPECLSLLGLQVSSFAFCLSLCVTKPTSCFSSANILHLCFDEFRDKSSKMSRTGSHCQCFFFLHQSKAAVRPPRSLNPGQKSPPVCFYCQFFLECPLLNVLKRRKYNVQKTIYYNMHVLRDTKTV